MIPPVVPPDTPSPGEIEVFHRLRDDPGTRDWIVLHSLDVAHHRTRIAGEIDFVVLVPGRGIVCVEVKAHTQIRHTGGQWLFGRGEEPGLSPFKQVSTAMHSIRDWVCDRHPELSGVLFWSCVVFPRVDLSAVSPEWRTWQLIDQRALGARPISALLTSVLDSGRELVASQRARWLAPVGEPTAPQCEQIAHMLRPEFEVYENPKARRRREDAAIRQFTEEQFEALDDLELNERVVFHGPAGTGKTLLALETARRAHDAGRRVLLVCFNDLLGTWLQDQAEPLGPSVVAGTLHQHMLRVAGIAVPSDAGPSFWTDELPARATEALIERGDELLVDEIVVDEAQDLLRESFLGFLDYSLRGGLRHGRLRLFGDFDRQALYQAATLSRDDLRARHVPDIAFRGLRVNCRNAPRVVRMVRQLCRLDPDYRRVLRPDDQMTPRIRYYRDAADQQRLLAEALQRLYDERFSGRDITVLSTRADRGCAAAALTAPPWGDRLRSLRQAGQGHVGYCSIWSFKGMEAPAVVVTDVDTVADDEARALFYVALTRPLHSLTVLASERIREDVLRMIE
jgi:hypothetical protein